MKVQFVHGYSLPCKHKQSGDLNQTDYVGSITCPECIDILSMGWIFGMRDGIDTGLVLTPNKNTEYCPCGGKWILRINKDKDVRFLGCSRFPKCKNTKTI